MAKGSARDARRELQWRRLVRKRERSGLTVRQFCRENNLPESAFYYWRRELSRRQAEQEKGRPSDAPPAPAFVPVLVAEDPRAHAAGPGPIEIELPDGRRVHVPSPVDRQALADVLAVLRQDELDARESRPC